MSFCNSQLYTMKSVILLLCLLISGSSFCQDLPPSVPPPTIANKPIVTDDIYSVVENMPQYPGGDEAMMEFIQQNIRYPDTERENDIQGRVVVGFVVNIDGSLSDIKIKKGVSQGIDDEALRVVGMFPKFSPGTQQGQVVRVNYLLPIMFKLALSNTSNERSEIDTFNKYKREGDAQSLYQKACEYIDSRNYVTAKAYLELGLEKHYPPSLTRLGYIYENGDDVKRDYRRAIRYIKEAADSGYSNAQVEIGYLYEMGKGVSADEVTAAGWYKKAAEQNNMIGLYNLGNFYQYGAKEISKNDSIALSMYRKSAEQGYAKSQFKMGDFYEYGRGRLAKDTNQAMKWYALGAMQHHGPSLNGYAWCCYLRNVNIDKAILCVQEALALDSNLYRLDTYAALLYLKGNFADAEKMERKAIEAGADTMPEYLERYGDILFKLNRTKEAGLYWQKALDRPDHSSRLAAKLQMRK